MRVLFVSSEMVPLAKSGGLADVIGSLPRAVQSLGHDVRVVIPLYKTIKDEYLTDLQFLAWTTTKMGWRKVYSGLFRMDVQGVPVYFIDNEYYFGHKDMYLEYTFDIERFTFFQRAVLDQLGERMDFYPEVLHLNDWQTGMIPVLLEAHFWPQGYFKNLKSVFTIHNLKYQGIHSREFIQDLTDLDEEFMTEDRVLNLGTPNYMKAGIIFSNWVTTVSPAYAEEVMMDYYGEGLNHVLGNVKGKFSGILNGLDIDSFDPKKDFAIAKNYGKHNWRVGKKANKKALQERLNLELCADVPVIAMVTRLVSQKGVDLVLHILDELLQEDVQFVLMGTGDYQYEQGFKSMEELYPDKMRALIEFNEEFSRQFYAGADMFVMPSLFEPCGLSQMIALRYGTLPIVRETGGLRDTVEPYNQYDGTGNGFSFANVNAHELLFKIKEACSLYLHQQEDWGRMVRRGLSEDFSWEASAKRYEVIYEKILEN